MNFFFFFKRLLKRQSYWTSQAYIVTSPGCFNFEQLTLNSPLKRLPRQYYFFLFPSCIDWVNWIVLPLSQQTMVSLSTQQAMLKISAQVTAPSEDRLIRVHVQTLERSDQCCLKVVCQGTSWLCTDCKSRAPAPQHFLHTSALQSFSAVKCQH